MLNIVKLPPQRFRLPRDVVERRSVLLFEALDLGQPVFYFLEALGRRVDRSRVRSEKEREVLELRFHGRASIEIGAESAVERGKI